MKIYSSRQRRGKEARLDQLIGKDLWIEVGYNQLSWFIRILDKTDVDGIPSYVVNKLGYTDTTRGYLGQAHIDIDAEMHRRYLLPINTFSTYFGDDFEAYTTEELLEIIRTAGGNR